MSGLDFQTVDVKFANKGQDTKTQAKMLVPGEWSELHNMTLSEDGTPKIRDGHAALVGRSGTSLATRGGELLVLDGQTGLWSYAAAGAGSTHQVAGAVSNLGIAKIEVNRTIGFQDAPDMACGDGYVCHVWTEYADAASLSLPAVKVMIADGRTGATVMQPTQCVGAATGLLSQARVVFADNAFFVFWIVGNGAVQSLQCDVIATSAPTVLGATVSLIAGDASLPVDNFDAIVFNSRPTVACRYTGGGVSGIALDVTRTGTVPSVGHGPASIMFQAQIPTATIQGISLCAFDSATCGFFVAVSGGGGFGGISGRTFSNAFVTTSIHTSLDGYAMGVAGRCHIVTVLNGANVAVFADQQSSYSVAGGAFVPIRTVTVTSALAVAVAAYTPISSACFDVNAARAAGPQGPFIAGKPIVANARVLLPVWVLENFFLSSATGAVFTTNAQNSWFLLDFGALSSTGTVPIPLERALYGSLGLVDTTLGGAAPTLSTPCSTVASDIFTGAYYTTQLERLSLQTVQATNVTPVGLCRLTIGTDTTIPTARGQLGPSAFVGVGTLNSYDGVRVTEHGFFMYPEGINCTVTAPGTGSVTAGVHSLCATYEWTDAAGQRHQSAPSPAIQFTFANATDIVTVIVPSLLLSQKTGVTISLWMTEAGGVTFYRVVPSFTANTTNTTTARQLTLAIGAVGGQSATDDRLRRGELLYSQPTQTTSTLPNIAPGPCSCHCIHQNRLFLDVTDDPLAFQYSQPLQPNTGLMFNPALRKRVPAESGGIVGMAALDEKLIIFCGQRNYVMYGSGPRPDGSYEQYSDPQDVESPDGCIDARSILAEASGGVIFKSPNGWMMLGRDLSTKYIGAGVSAYDNYACSAAVMVGDQQEARFVLTAASVTLAYSYLLDAWSIYQYGGGYSPLDAIHWVEPPTTPLGLPAQKYATIDIDGVNVDVAGTTFDSTNALGDTGFEIGGTSSWLHLDALESYQRIRRAYFSFSATNPNSTLVIGFYFDDSDATSNPNYYSISVPCGTVTLGGLNTTLDFRHKLRFQKCKSMRFKWSETPASPAANRISGLQALALEVGIKRGVRKLPAAQTVG